MTPILLSGNDSVESLQNPFPLPTYSDREQNFDDNLGSQAAEQTSTEPIGKSF